MRPLRALVFYGASADNVSFSYQHGWPKHLARHPRFQCTLVNLLDPGKLAAARRLLVTSRWRGDAIVLLHSAFSNACLLSPRVIDLIAQAPGAKVYFIGNEYKHMPEKLAMCERIGVSLLVSQTADERPHALYRQRLKCAVMGLPNTGLDPEVFRPARPRRGRPIDIGYRSDVHAYYLGHVERETIAAYFRNHAAAWGLSSDISTSAADRFDGEAWAAFLNRCKGQIGTEAGTDYFELTDETRVRVNAYVNDHPEVGFDEIQKRFFRDYQGPVPMRIISGRNIEAAGTMTVQLLFEGRYDGYFQPDVHYIPLAKDFSNAGDAIRKLRDDDLADRIATNAYDLVMCELTYARLIDRFTDALASLV